MAGGEFVVGLVLNQMAIRTIQGWPDKLASWKSRLFSRPSGVLNQIAMRTIIGWRDKLLGWKSRVFSLFTGEGRD